MVHAASLQVCAIVMLDHTMFLCDNFILSSLQFGPGSAARHAVFSCDAELLGLSLRSNTQTPLRGAGVGVKSSISTSAGLASVHASVALLDGTQSITGLSTAAQQPQAKKQQRFPQLPPYWQAIMLEQEPQLARSTSSVNELVEYAMYEI
jgi:hypothetical protein